MLANRAVNGMRLSPGNPRSIRDETLPGCQDDDADKINLWIRLSKLSETAEQGDARSGMFLSQLPVVTQTRPSRLGFTLICATCW